jgi:hypothetical protein
MVGLVKAMLIARRAHYGQKDKAGEDYFRGHITRVIRYAFGIPAKIIAALHDTIEDTDATEEFLRGEGFSKIITSGVLSVTVPKGESHASLIARARKHMFGRQVREIDYEHNNNLKRFRQPPLDRIKKTRQYHIPNRIRLGVRKNRPGKRLELA